MVYDPALQVPWVYQRGGKAAENPWKEKGAPGDLMYLQT